MLRKYLKELDVFGRDKVSDLHWIPPWHTSTNRCNLSWEQILREMSVFKRFCVQSIFNQFEMNSVDGWSRIVAQCCTTVSPSLSGHFACAGLRKTSRFDHGRWAGDSTCNVHMSSVSLRILFQTDAAKPLLKCWMICWNFNYMRLSENGVTPNSNNFKWKHDKKPLEFELCALF